MQHPEVSAARSSRQRPAPRSSIALIGVLVALAALLPPSAIANGLGENGSWQFQTQADKMHKGAIVDLIERKKGGFYESYKVTNYNNTYIDKQFNCSLAASSSGNAGSNGLTSNTSSPTSESAGTTRSDTTANSATNGVTQAGFPGVITLAGLGTPGTAGTVDNAQSNSGSLSSGVNGSTTTSSTGAINAAGGTSNQSMDSAQTNSGSQTASVSGSTACQGPLVGPLN